MKKRKNSLLLNSRLTILLRIPGQSPAGISELSTSYSCYFVILVLDIMAAYEIVKTVELSSMPNPALAKDLLERLRLATKVVVAKHKWRVPVLKEFYPKNHSLLGLNVNRGQSIMIRLREGSDQFSFLPWHSVLGTLVHELTHNEVGEHSAEFYKKMEELYDEVEASSGGVNGSGGLWGPVVPKYNFDGVSAKVGGGSLAKSVGVAKDNIRRLAAEAALRRNKGIDGARVLGGSVGGAGPGSGLPVSAKERKALFLQAEERRRQEGCSVVKGPPGSSNQNNAGLNSPGQTGINSTSSSSKSIMGSGSGSKGTIPALPLTPLTEQWLCQVCMEKNNGGSGTCVWCGCAFGSTLEGASVSHADKDSGKGDYSSNSIDSSSNIRSNPFEEYSLAGLCRNTLYEVRNCSCCVARFTTDFTRTTAASSNNYSVLEEDENVTSKHKPDNLLISLLDDDVENDERKSTARAVTLTTAPTATTAAAAGRKRRKHEDLTTLRQQQKRQVTYNTKDPATTIISLIDSPM